MKIPPVFSLQIWDNDLFSPDDYVGNIDLRLSSMPPPFKSASKAFLRPEKPTPQEEQVTVFASTDNLQKGKYVSIFEAKKVRGWFSCSRGSGEKRELSVKHCGEDWTDGRAKSRWRLSY